MHEFLYRRRNGIVILIIASVLMIGWLRSPFVSDQIRIEAIFEGPNQILYFYRSSNNAIRLICRFESVGRTAQEQELGAMPYFTIVVPLALLSAYLILWPGKRPERKMKPPE